MTEVRPDGQLEDRSLGELVAIAMGSVSRLIKSEIQLATMELKGDARRAAQGSIFFAFAGLVAGVAVILFSIFAALLLGRFVMPVWAAFGVVTGFYVLLALLSVGLGYRRMKKLEGARRTRRTVKDDLAVLRRGRTDKPALTD